MYKYTIPLVAFMLLCNILNAQTTLQEIIRFQCPWGNGFVNYVEANGDINGDGSNDLIFSCYADSSNNKIFIYHSIPDNNQEPDQILTSPFTIGGPWGGSFSYCGDLNGDGINDLIVSTHGYGIERSGAVSIYYGGNTISHEPDVNLFGADYTLDSWALHFGIKLLTNCDLNGDGYDDLIVYGTGPEMYYGSVFVFLGGQQFSTNCALHLVGNEEAANFAGNGLATGDINGDGYDDIVVTRKDWTVYAQLYNDVIDIYAGGPSLSDTPIFETTIVNETNHTGLSGRILANGDLNGDGFDDILLLYGTASEAYLKVIYGKNDFSELIVEDFLFPTYGGMQLGYYCDFNNDAYSDFSMQQEQLTPDGPELGYFTLFVQNSPILDLN